VRVIVMVGRIGGVRADARAMRLIALRIKWEHMLSSLWCRPVQMLWI
jgi:hypothetical protein